MISAAAEAARGTNIAIGAQNISEQVQGPYTGEVSCDHGQRCRCDFLYYRALGAPQAIP